jgi:hypothetical protein
MKDKITVLIPTSPIPSHPSTAILDETIANIRKYTDAKIIIMFDGVHPSLEHRRKDYEAYQNEVNFSKPEYGDYQCFFFAEHVHQAIMTRYVLMNLVSTPLIMFCEHDTSPIGDIPFDALCWFVEKGNVNHLRFNIFDKIPDEHQYLMLDEEPVNWGFGSGVRIVRTIQWSQRPHIAKTDWYKEILTTFLKDKKGMIEDVMHSVVQVKYGELGMDTFGLAIYTPQGNQLRSYHSDGRGGDEKIIES